MITTSRSKKNPLPKERRCIRCHELKKTDTEGKWGFDDKGVCWRCLTEPECCAVMWYDSQHTTELTYKEVLAIRSGLISLMSISVNVDEVLFMEGILDKLGGKEKSGYGIKDD